MTNLVTRSVIKQVAVATLFTCNALWTAQKTAMGVTSCNRHHYRTVDFCHLCILSQSRQCTYADLDHLQKMVTYGRTTKKAGTNMIIVGHKPKRSHF